MLAAAQREAGQRAGTEPRLEATLTDLRQELDRLQLIAERESAAREDAERRVEELESELRKQTERFVRVYHAIEELRGEIDVLRVARATQSEEAPEPSPESPVEAERLTAALSRLREASTPEPPELQPRQATSATKAWLGSVFEALASQDPSTAGRLLLALLPAQHLIHPEPVVYDLVLGELACVRVTATNGRTHVDFGESPRPVDEVDFRVTGELAAIARLVATGRARRRFRRRLARVRGERARFAALTRLARAPFTLSELHAAGVLLDASLALTVVSLMVDPGWTVGERFTIAHQETGAPIAGTYLLVRDGAPLSVTATPPRAPILTTIVGPAVELVPVLSGDRPAGSEIHGDSRPVELLRGWLELAQSG
jgi:hypothetical protein